MHDPKTGRVDPMTFGWDNRATGGARLGTSITITITEGLTIDGTGASAFGLGWAQGAQYSLSSGEEGESGTNVPGAQIQLSNCFASMYAFFSSLDTFGHNLNNMSPAEGGNKYFDILFIDPTHIIADFVVNIEMCEIKRIIEQIKDMASLDYAAIADNATREFLVLVTETPEARRAVREIRQAGKCLQDVAEDATGVDLDFVIDKVVDNGEDQWQTFDDSDDDGVWNETGNNGVNNFQADIDELQRSDIVD